MMKIFAVRLNPDPRSGLPYSKYPTVNEYHSIHQTSPMNGFHEAINFLAESGVVRGYLPPKHLKSIRSEERFCLVTVSAKTASENADMIFGIQVCCTYVGEKRRSLIKKGKDKIELTYHYSCPATHSLLFDVPIANGRELILEKDRYWGQGPAYEITKKTLSKIIRTAVRSKNINKDNARLKNILNWINDGKNIVIVDEDIDATFDSEVEELVDAGELALPTGNPNPGQREVVSYKHVRDPKVAAYALRKANGICQDCNSPAPFTSKKTKRPYLEVHHIVTLKNDGPDTVENVIALCPNCHRKRHFG